VHHRVKNWLPDLWCYPEPIFNNFQRGPSEVVFITVIIVSSSRWWMAEFLCKDLTWCDAIRIYNHQLPGIRHPDCWSLLSIDKWAGPGWYTEFHYIHCSLDQVEHGFQIPDYNHIVVNPYKIFAIIVLFSSSIVLLYWLQDFTEFNELWFSDNFRIDVLTFWHGFWVLCCLLFVACCLLLVVQNYGFYVFLISFFWNGFSILHECNSPFPILLSPFHF